jgi:hypothetical protein
MANERYAELAAEALHAFVAAGIDAALSDVETAQGLSAGTIRRPVAVVRARAAARDNRSPLVAVYWSQLRPLSQREGLVEVDCTIAVQLVASTAASTEPLEADHARYMTAILDMIRDDPHLAGRVVAALWTDADADAGIGDNSTTRLVSAVGIAVRVAT